MTKRDFKNPVSDVLDATTRIVAEGCFVNNDTRRTGLNNNDLIVGASGAGKTRGYVMPNIMHSDESMIVVDTKGQLYGQLSNQLAARGFEVWYLDFANPVASTIGYNPMNYIERYGDDRLAYNEREVEALCNYISPVETSTEPFWERSAQMYLAAFVAYALEALPEEEQNLGTVATLAKLSSSETVATLFSEWGTAFPSSYAYGKWKLTQTGKDADRTISCIRLFCSEKLAPFEGKAIQELFDNPKQVDFARMGQRRCALFVNVSDTDRSSDKLVGLLYSQAIHELCRAADALPEGHLEVPVRLILDDFAAGTRVADFDRLISTIRSRNIYASVILQSLSQLKSMYGPDAAKTIENNCDTCLYLGGLDVETARHFAEKANVPTSKIINLPVGEGYLFVRGQKARRARGYDIESDERYAALQAEPGDLRREPPAPGREATNSEDTIF